MITTCYTQTRTKRRRKKRVDEHSLRAVFIDQVDMHTGEGISMRSIVSRWPTLITDFLRMDDDDLDMDKVKDKLTVSKAEAVVLVTKNKLYQEWKKLFMPEIKSRFQRICELVRSREESVRQYKEWLKPVIARHKMLEEGYSNEDIRARHFYMGKTGIVNIIGSSVATSVSRFWAWRDFTVPEIYRRGGAERLAIEVAEGKVDCYDNWTKKNLIFHPKWGLITKYPWITDKWVQEQKKKFLAPGGGLIDDLLYYTFFIITFIRGNMRMGSGAEAEDTIFDVNAIYMSKNVVFTKMLEMAAQQQAFNDYIDSLLGIGHERLKTEIKPEKNGVTKIKNALESVGMGLQFRKSGPYERDWDERITKFHLTGMASYRYVPIVQFIKDKVGMGVS